MSAEPMTFDDIEKLPTARLRAELHKRNIECSDASRKVLIKRLREAIEDAIAVKCYSGTKCETGCLYWDIEWDAVECISAMGPGQSIKSTVIKVGDYDWYAELFPKGEIQKNTLSQLQCHNQSMDAAAAHALNLNQNGSSNFHRNLNGNLNRNLNGNVQQHLFMAPNHPQNSSSNNNINSNTVSMSTSSNTMNPALSTPDTVNVMNTVNAVNGGSNGQNGVMGSLPHHQCGGDMSAPSNSNTVSNAPALFLSICSTKKPVQMRFTVQLYHPTTARWSDPVISSLRVFRRNNHGWGWKEWMDYHDLKSSYASDGCDGGKLKLKITIDVYGPVNTHPMNDTVTFNLRSQLSGNMNKLFKSGAHSDVTVVVSGYTMYPNHCQHFLKKHENHSGSLDDDEEDEDDDITEGDNELTIINPKSSHSTSSHNGPSNSNHSNHSNHLNHSNSSRKRRLSFNDTALILDDNDLRSDRMGNSNSSSSRHPSWSLQAERQTNRQSERGRYGYKRRKLASPRRQRLCIDEQSSTYECIDNEVHLPVNAYSYSSNPTATSSVSSPYSSRKSLFHRHGKLSKNNKGSTCEKLADIGIDEECRDKSGRTFVTLEIPVHRCILANFSPYFESMFSHKFRENVDGKIFIGKQSENVTDTAATRDAVHSSSISSTSSTSNDTAGNLRSEDKTDNVDHGNGSGNNSGNGQNAGNLGTEGMEDTDERDDGTLSVIDNVDPFVMKVLLEYMYTEQIDHNVDRYLLLLLADRYQIERLVMICLQDLSNEMNINNVTIILSISNKFERKYRCADKVKQLCLDFICKNISFVMETSSYKNACKNDKTLTQEILTHFAIKHKQKSRNNAIISPQKHRGRNGFSLSPM